ncbi:uncharacterized protein BKA78DRAFT_247113 [Phyllosticta capitalensis]|uniref:uncharacterized protein n=1 Tax=Phyllosticta capitalensis TaxID=121624 RepID=UPI00312D8E73
MALDKATVDFLVNHVVLPPKQPQRFEGKYEEIKGEAELLNFVLEAMKSFSQQCDTRAQTAWQSAISALQNWQKALAGATLSQEPLVEVMSNLKELESLMLHLKSQNAGLLIRRNLGNSITLDAFEASAQSSEVIQTPGRMLWTFPGRSVMVPRGKFQDADFIKLFAARIQSLHAEQVPMMMPTSRKGGEAPVEERDTAHPGLVSEQLLSMITALGGDHVDGPRVQKLVRDEVNWDDSALPWRRSPLWLVIRVSISLVLEYNLHKTSAKTHYKNFIAFLIAEISDAVKDRTTTDLKAVINIKAARKLAKLSENGFDFVIAAVKSAVADSRGSLDDLWQQIQQNENRFIGKLPSIATDDDKSLRLSNSRPYLVEAVKKACCQLQRSEFQPKNPVLLKFYDNGLPCLDEFLDLEDRIIVLEQFEAWIFENLDSWKQRRVSCEEDCRLLSSTRSRYQELARPLYDGNARTTSVMLLVVVEVWRVIDIMCVESYSIMKDYRPEIPLRLLEPLLLPQFDHMEILLRIEEHLEKRYREARRDFPRILQDPSNGNDSFAVRFYDRSPKHQALRAEIDRESQARRDKKTQEWTRQSKKFEDLQHSAKQLEHTHRRWGWRARQNCQKCTLEEEASSMSIMVDEWALPDDLVQLKVAVFELDCPSGFASWRDTVWSIIQDLGRGEPVQGSSVQATLFRYENLSHKASSKGQRITLGSMAKSFLVSHYRESKFPVALDSVLLKNALQYRLMDGSSLTWVTDQRDEPSFHASCVSLLPPGAYADSRLQDFVNCRLAPNEAIARQGDCAPGINHHEFLAFASLRAGERIQLLNVLRELGSQDLALGAEEVHILIRQATLQSGSSNGNGQVLRVAHQVFEDDEFCGQLLNLLCNHIEAVQANWKEQHRLSTLIVLGLRILSLSTTPAILDRAQKLIRRVREVALSWCRQITSQLPLCSTESSAQNLRVAILRSALACHLTFDTDPENTPKILKTLQDVSDLIEASIHVFNNRPIRKEDLPREVQHNLLISHKLSQKLLQLLRKILSESDAGVNQALGIICNMTEFAGKWTFPVGPGSSWVANETSEISGGRRQKLHLNLLNGELLVDGQPLGRLPAQFTEKPLYRRVFGSRILNVAASSLPQMQYRSLDLIEGHEVHVGLNGGELLIKAVTDMQTLRVIPHEVFQGDIPHRFQHDFVHWMDIENRKIEFRPVKNPWARSLKTMEMAFDPDAMSSMQVGRDKLIDSRSPLGKAVCEIFSVIERAAHLVVTAPRSEEGRIEVELPRFGVKFFINKDGILESQQLSSTVAEEQDVKCLYGLQNKLVLRSTGSHASIDQRSVMIPLGSVSISSIDGHRRVGIETGHAEKVRFVQYYQNTVLGTLQGASDITEILFKAYLHATTTFVLPDPLTQQTGTSEALLTLSDQRLKTSFPLSKEAILLLRKISELTPMRQFYPKHLQKMQTVSWHPSLGQLAQDEAFFTLAFDIYSHNSRFKFAMPSTGNDVIEDLPSDIRGNWILLKRASLRNASVRIPFLKQAATDKDQPYAARDRGMGSARSLRVHNIASMIREGPSQIDVIENLSARVQSWSEVGGYRKDFEQEMEATLTNILNFPVARYWGLLYDLCHDYDEDRDRYKLMFLFATMTFLDSGVEPYLRTLLGIAFSGRFRGIMPDHSSYTLRSGKTPVSSTIEAKISNFFRGFEEMRDEDEEDREERFKMYSQQKVQQTAIAVRHVTSQWPCNAPTLPPQSQIPLLDFATAARALQLLFTEWNKNRLFSIHIDRVEEVLKDVHISTPFSPSKPRELPLHTTAASSNNSQQIYSSLVSLLGERAPPMLGEAPPTLIAVRSTSHMEISSDYSELRQILETLQSGGNQTRVAYLNDQISSLKALEDFTTMELPKEILESLETLLQHRAQSLDFLRQCFDTFRNVLRPSSACAEVAAMAGLWPRTTTSALLANLSTKSIDGLSEDWTKALTILGEAVALFQRSERLVNFKLKNNVLSFYKEAEDAGRQGWTSTEHPEWLLIEIEGNIQIRHIQAIVAKQMIAPDGNENSTLQLNMGEGKSSVIIPMTLAALADRSQLARLICPKPLLKQTNSLLSMRLGGLVGRPVYHIPFSRDTRLNEAQVSSLRLIYKECMEQQGAILSLPEHIHSFRLMGREQLPIRQGLAKSIISTDLWLQEHCRDVLDESDDLLDSRFQLVYSMGNQQHMDGQPDRWLLVMAVLSLLVDAVKREADQLSSLEVDYRGRSFPFLTFLDPQACPILLDLLVEGICEGHLAGVSFEHCSTIVRRTAQKFIQQRDLSTLQFKIVEEAFEGTPMWLKLHLLRGLFAYKILEFTLQNKLWLVNYGLALDRCLMAVPYRAKGTPSARAEYGHPDVAITLTCLSYYFGGLTHDQLRHCFEILFSETDPSSEYVRWATDSLPLELRSLDGVNLDDQDLWASKVFPALRYSKGAADFFMARVVFPREGKEFPTKLSLSAWDLPSTNKKMITTGFSGTNDNKSLLPTSIKQHDLPQLRHTSAMVQNLLLKQGNRMYAEAKNSEGRRLDLDGLLRMVATQQQKVQILIDVGAQVLEAGNEEVARKWLELSPEYEAAVFFNEADEVMVLDRDSHVEFLSASPFKRKLDHCVVYLDEVHTRGVDLDLPLDARAAVTLGPSLTKDRLVQGCMRLRKLGCNQSIVYFAPPEVHQAILALSGKIDASRLDSADVLQWAFVQTCNSIDKMKGLYLVQGLEYRHRTRVCSKLFGDNIEVPLTEEAISSFNKEILEPEARTLVEMYGADARNNTIRPCLMDKTAENDPVARPLIAQWKSSNYGRSQDHVLQEEQEREISHEVEQEREIQKAPYAEALPHTLHKEVVEFVKTGIRMSHSSAAFSSALTGLVKTTAHEILGAVDHSCISVFVTLDFMRTVKQGKVPDQDQFIRPAKFIVSSKFSNDLVIISPYEANALLPEFRTSQTVRLHMYSPMTSKQMQSFSDLMFYTVTDIDSSTPLDKPSLPTPLSLSIAQLDVFASCLFLKDYASYLWVCDFLGLVARKDRTDGNGRSQGVRITSDGFADPASRAAMSWPVASPFKSSPLPFLRALMGIRRKGQAYSQTHLGNVTNGRVLTEESLQAV